MTEQRSPLRAAPEPLEADDALTVKVGTAVWFALFVGQLPFYGWYSDHGHAWWIWSCLVGTVLGLIGLRYVTSRQRAIKRSAERDAAENGPADR
jgi:hypothetical protein